MVQGPFPHYLTLADPSEPARPRHLAYYEWGDADNSDVVICVHGLTRNGRDFDSLAHALSSRHRVICPDMAGRGKSSWLSNKSDYNYPLYIADCVTLLDRLGLPQVKWIGTSMGGIIGMMIAASQKQRIKQLILNDVGAIISAAGLKRILGYVGVGGTFANAQEAMQYLKSVLAPFHITQEVHWGLMFDSSFVALPGGRYGLAYDPAINQPFRDMVSQGQTIADVDLSAAWKEVSCPTLIIRGEHSDILTRQAAEAMLSHPAPVKLIEIKDAGHAPALLEESQIGIILNWLGG